VDDDIQFESPLPAWDRSQLWRQGSVFTRETCVSLGFEAYLNRENSIAIVATHDCDCVSSISTDPTIEIVMGEIIPESKRDGNYHNGKNVRVLHLPISSTNQIIEIRSSPKLMVNKVSLVMFRPDIAFNFSSSEKETFSRWLAARYSRGSFPDELMTRLDKVKLDLEAAGKIDPDSVLGIYIDYDPRADIADENEPYSLIIAVVYKAENEHAQEAAERVVKKIKDSFEKRYKTLETSQFGIQWRGIELQVCEAVSDETFSLRDTLNSVLYRLEHISLRQSPQTEIPIQL
jgi:hypothetical protein